MNISTVRDLLSSAATKRPEKVYLCEKDKKGAVISKTFQEFFCDVRKVASFLSKKNGERVHAGIISSSGIFCITVLLGSMCGAHVAVPVNPRLSLDDICDDLNRADVTALFYDRSFLEKLDSIKRSCPQIITYVCLDPAEGVFSVGEILSANSFAEDKTPKPSDRACILYTSGTTGKRKGVMLSHANLIDNVFCCDNEGDENDILLSVLPVHHAYCLTCDVLLSLRYGATLCFNDSPMHLMQDIKLFRPTMMLFVPQIAQTLYRRMIVAKKTDPLMPVKDVRENVFGGRLRVIFCGGAYLSPKLVEAYEEMGIPLLQGYGMTECSPRISSSSTADPSTGNDTGRVVKNCRIRIVDGEIQVKSPSVMMGYYNDEEATSEMFTSDGWLKTGDLGYVKDEHVYITGRKKNLIILSNGENLSPEELENRFADYDWISEVMVCQEGEGITAEVYPYPEFAGRAEKLLEKAAEEINSTLPPGKRITKLRIRNTGFEKTDSQKIKRRSLKYTGT
ncbi:MAG: AMP-binding protein [Lachnospiraceae bacterium]|nr:AMP-binding protein [Lachnospiraceae bacterium]